MCHYLLSLQSSFAREFSGIAETFFDSTVRSTGILDDAFTRNFIMSYWFHLFTALLPCLLLGLASLAFLPRRWKWPRRLSWFCLAWVLTLLFVALSPSPSLSRLFSAVDHLTLSSCIYWFDIPRAALPWSYS